MYLKTCPGFFVGLIACAVERLGESDTVYERTTVLIHRERNGFFKEKDSDETADLATHEAPRDTRATRRPWTRDSSREGSSLRLRAGLKDAHYTRVVAAAFLEFH